MPLKSSIRSNPVWHRVFRNIIAASSLLTILTGSPAFADEVSEVSKLMRAGQQSEALKKADAFLSQRPRDAQLRFLKGVILAEQNKSSEAIALFAKLTEDFPELPEPHNNLAVLHAAEGQFEKARVSLDKAIRTNPAYATAYENLGDVHAKLASQAYDKALQLDSKNSVAKSKLTLVRSLVDTSGGAIQVAAAVPVAKAASPSSAPVAALPEKKNAVPEINPASLQVATANPEASKDIPKPVQKAAPDNGAERTAILNAVNGWAKAWSAQDVKAYLGYYSNDFDTPNGMSRKAWSDERRARIAGKGRITVTVAAPQVTVNENSATVKFRQGYVSDRLTSNSRKTLVLAKAGGKWQITQERTGN